MVGKGVTSFYLKVCYLYSHIPCIGALTPVVRTASSADLNHLVSAGSRVTVRLQFCYFDSFYNTGLAKS